MDYFAHGAWSYIIFRNWRAIIFGLLPDSMSWLIFFFYNLFNGGFVLRNPVIENLPSWIFLLYDISHSLVVAFVVIGLIYFIFKKFYVYMLAWPLAIVFDLFTHTRDFLPTPFLWPLSDWKFDGISWAEPWFMILNWGLIIIFFVYIYIRKNYLKKGIFSRL